MLGTRLNQFRFGTSQEAKIIFWCSAVAEPQSTVLKLYEFIEVLIFFLISLRH